MTIDVRKVGRVCVMTFKGRLVFGEPTELMTRRFKELLDAEERLFVFDMRDVPLVDSTAIGATVACLIKNARQYNHKIKLVLSQELRRIFVDFCKLESIFDISNDTESAIASLA